MQEAAAALAAAAAVQEDTPADDEAAEISDDVLDGLRRLDQGGSLVTWFVYCESPIEREGFIEKLRTEQLDEQRFKAKYGPGEYKVIGRTTDGHYVRGSHKVIKISGILAADTNPTAAGGDALSLLREMRAQDDARAKSRADDLKTYATVLGGPFATILAALIARRPAVDIAALVTALRPQQSTLSEMTTALVNLKAMQGDQGGGNIELVLKVLERLPDLPQGGAGEGGWLGFFRDVIKEAAPHARELIGRMQQPAQPGQLPPGSTSGPAFGPGTIRTPVLPAPNPAANGGTAPTPTASGPLPPSSLTPQSTDPAAPTDQGNDMWVIAEPWLRRRAEDLHEWAASNMEVELCAEMLLASVPKMFRAVLSAADLVQLLQRPDWWQQLTAFHPPLAPYQAWIDDARQELLQLLGEQQGEPPPDHNPEGTTQ